MLTGKFDDGLYRGLRVGEIQTEGYMPVFGERLGQINPHYNGKIELLCRA